MASHHDRFNNLSGLVAHSQRRPFSPSKGNVLKHVAVAAILAMLFTPGDAFFDTGICCMLAVRDNLTFFDDDPWTVCGTDEPYVYLNPTAHVSVNKSMEWCQQNCGGYQSSNTYQWLDPLATWVIPAFSLLLLCSIGESGHDGDDCRENKAEENLPNKPITDKPSGKIGFWVRRMYFWVQEKSYKPKEYINLLGDPVSAIFGGFSELWMDAFMLKTLRKDRLPLDIELVKVLIGIYITAGQTKFPEAQLTQFTKYLTQNVILDALLLAIDTAIENNGDSEQYEKAVHTTTIEVSASRKPRMPQTAVTDLKDLRRGLQQLEISELPLLEEDPTKDSSQDPILKLLQKVGSASQETALQRKVTLLQHLKHFRTALLPGGVESTTTNETDLLYDAIKAALDEDLRGHIKQKGKPSKYISFVGRFGAGIRTVLTARIDFVNGVFLPLVLLLATTASTFHDAYGQNGDSETAHNLSYGIWYSWVIILAVVSNSYAASINTGVAEAAFTDLLELFSITVPLRKRFSNARQWEDWVWSMCYNAEKRKNVVSGWNFYLQYLGGQLLAWCCIAYACACASAISYTTPTIGVGCDTFTYILYGVNSFVISWLSVLRHWVRSRVGKGGLDDMLRVIYATLVFVNAFVVFGSTLFHLIGLYRSCRCMRLFGSSSALLELNAFTQLALDQATNFWLPVGYMAFTGVWIVCLTAILFRAYISRRIHTCYLTGA